MSDKRKDYKLYLLDIKLSCKKIFDYTKSLPEAKFKKDPKTVDAVIKNLEVIGEAVGKIPKEIRDKIPEVEWQKIISMRNKLIHEYFDLNVDTVWQTVSKDIPLLKKQIDKTLKSLGKSKLK